jgi:ferredoxin-NADP reductase
MTSFAATERRLRVGSLTWEATDVLSLTLVDAAGGQLPPWRPGAHIDFAPAAGLVAQYSLCGTVGAREWRIAVLLQREGKGVSRWVHERLRPGEIIRASDPRNNFTLVSAPSYLFLAGGIGITPFLPMIDALRSKGCHWRLAYGGRRRESLAFADTLTAYGSAVQLYPQDETGHLPLDALLGSVEADCAVYCCGPESLIDAVERWLSAKGKPSPHVERFNAKPLEPGKETKRFQVVLAKSNVTLDIPADKSIADILDKYGVFVPTSCREGVCGSCETRVISGSIDHRDSLLSAEERARQDTMMVCISRAAGNLLTLDL